MQLNEILNWRYATKKYRGRKVSADNINEILEAIRLSASSAGIQPYKVILVENDELRKKLQQASFNPQITEASHLLIFAAYDKIGPDHINDYINLIYKERSAPPDSLSPFKSRLEENLLK